LFGLFQGVSSETIGDQYRVVPNQGIRRSARNSLILGLISTVIAMLSYGLMLEPSNVLALVLSDMLSNGLIFGLSVGLLAGLLYGGLACLRHSVIRLLLWRSKSIPWNYPRFLDYATEHILLRKVGGGYIFLHRLLLDYFAAQKTPPVLDEVKERRQASTSEPASTPNVPSEQAELTVLSELSVPMIAQAFPTPRFETPRSLPCGHEQRTANARFCSVCGAPVQSSTPE